MDKAPSACEQIEFYHDGGWAPYVQQAPQVKNEEGASNRRNAKRKLEIEPDYSSKPKLGTADDDIVCLSSDDEDDLSPFLSLEQDSYKPLNQGASSLANYFATASAMRLNGGSSDPFDIISLD